MPRTRYLDTLDNAVELRRWTARQGLWPFGPCVLYSNRFHVLRVRLCFRVAGFRLFRIVGARPVEPRGLIAQRLWYYDYPALNIVYEAMATGYALLRLAARPGRIVKY